MNYWIKLTKICFLLFLNVFMAQAQLHDQRYSGVQVEGNFQQNHEHSFLFNAAASTSPTKMFDGTRTNVGGQKNFQQDSSFGDTMNQDSSHRNSENYPQGFNFKIQRNPNGRLDVVESPNINQRSDEIKRTSTTGIIHFPTPPTRSTPTTNGNAPRCSAGGDSFCTQVDNYPTDQVAKVIQQDSFKFEAVFGEDLVPEIPEVSQRIDPGEESLCSSLERLIFPQAALTKDNNWSFIVNHENYTQGVRIEECSAPGKTCAMTESFPNGYKTECKQKYIYRQMLGFNASGKVVKDLYRLPSCCKCIIKFH